jgi:Raf kinase inhibitor-like YbhB/YbcL family protein
MRHQKYFSAELTRRGAAWVTLALAVTALAACESGGYPSAANLTPSSGATITLTSPAFKNGLPIPADYTCDRAGISPALNWTDPPLNAHSFALIMDDPDAPSGTFTHWIVFNIPSSARSLPQDEPAAPVLSDGSKQGTNSFGKLGYGGPCPPNGIHHYHFRLYALDTSLSLTEGIGVSQLRSAMDGHVVAAGELVGTYSR